MKSLTLTAILCRFFARPRLLYCAVVLSVLSAVVVGHADEMRITGKLKLFA